MKEKDNLPHDNDAERSLLSAFMFDGKRLQQVFNTVGKIKYTEFFSKTNGLIFRAIESLSADTDDFSPIKIVTVLKKNNLLNGELTASYVTGLLTLNVSGSDAVYLAKRVRDLYQRRCLIEICKKYEDAAWCDEDFESEGASLIKSLSDAQNDLTSLQDLTETEREQGVINLSKVCASWYQKAKEDQENHISHTGIPTGFTELDNLTSGLKKGTLNVIAARSGVGKTAFAMNIVENVITNPDITKPVLIFELEMTAEQILWRILAGLGKIPVQHLADFSLTELDCSKLVTAIGQLYGEDPETKQKFEHIFIDASAKMTPQKMMSRARTLAEKTDGIAMIVVDHLQIMDGDKDYRGNDVRKYADISRSMKLMAKEFDCPVLCLSQLNREIDKRKEHRPMNSDLKETSAIEQDADLIMFVHRDSAYEQKSAVAASDTEDAKLIVTKNRHGATADLDLQYVGKYVSFYNKNQMSYGEEYVNA